MSNIVAICGMETDLSTVHIPLSEKAAQRYQYRMEIDLTGIVERIETKAKALGLNVTEVSRRAGKPDIVRNWQRAVRNRSDLRPRLDTLQSVADVLGISLDWLLRGEGHEAFAHATAPIAGFADAATPFQFREPAPGSTAPSPSLSAIFGAAAGTPASYRLSTDLPAFSLFNGNIVIVDLSRLPRPGELAIVSVFDEETASAVTAVRRYAPPHLVSGDSYFAPQIERMDNPAFTVRHPIIGSIRGCPLPE